MHKRLRTAVALVIALGAVFLSCSAEEEPIKVGILHSLSGTMAVSEKPVADATLMAIEEINAAGGVLGRRIEPVIADGRSDEREFAVEAERLITEGGVAAIFGCWTSSSRKEVREVVERLDHLLFYPVQYEGLEESPNIVYSGATPNQQILPAVNWSLEEFGKRFFLVGSDYIFPHVANAIIRDQLALLGGEVVGEEYLLLGSGDVDDVVAGIAAAAPDVVLNTLNGDTNIAFFRELRSKGAVPATIPTVSFSIAENELQAMEPGTMVNDFAAWNYFQSIDSPENRRFVDVFKARYGSDRTTSDPMEAGYFNVHLWAQAVRAGGAVDPLSVRGRLGDQQFYAPGGLVTIDPGTHHLWRTIRIGKVQPDGQFDIILTSNGPVRPEPFPDLRREGEWELFLDELYRGWGGSWSRREVP